MNAHSDNVVPPDPVPAGDTDCIPPCTMASVARKAAVSRSATGEVHTPYTQDDQDALVTPVAVFYVHPSLITSVVRQGMNSELLQEYNRAIQENDFIRTSYANSGRFWSSHQGHNKFILRVVAGMLNTDVMSFLNSVLNQHGCAAGHGDWPETYVLNTPEDAASDSYHEDHEYDCDATYNQAERATCHVIKRCLEVLGQDARDRQIIVTGDIL